MSRGEVKAKQGAETRQRILDQGIKVWLKNPDDVTANKVGKAMKPAKTHAGVLYHFPQGIKDAVAEHAVKIGCAEIIVQLITAKHPAIKKLSAVDRAKYLKSI